MTSLRDDDHCRATMRYGRVHLCRRGRPALHWQSRLSLLDRSGALRSNGAAEACRMRAPLSRSRLRRQRPPNRACGASCEGNSKITRPGQRGFRERSAKEENGCWGDPDESEPGRARRRVRWRRRRPGRWTVKSSGAGIDDDQGQRQHEQTGSDDGPAAGDSGLELRTGMVTGALLASPHVPL